MLNLEQTKQIMILSLKLEQLGTHKHKDKLYKITLTRQYATLNIKVESPLKRQHQLKIRQKIQCPLNPHQKTPIADRDLARNINAGQNLVRIINGQSNLATKHQGRPDLVGKQPTNTRSGKTMSENNEVLASQHFFRRNSTGKQPTNTIKVIGNLVGDGNNFTSVGNDTSTPVTSRSMLKTTESTGYGSTGL
jgi:hypothetical protein